MPNRVTVTIGGQSYTLVATEDGAYIKDVAAYVNRELDDVMENGKLSLSNAAVLTAMNIADKYFKERGISDNLRRQLKDYLDETARVKLELAESKRQIFKMQNEKK